MLTAAPSTCRRRLMRSMVDANHESSVMWFQPQISQKLDIQTISTIDVNQFANKMAFDLL